MAHWQAYFLRLLSPSVVIPRFLDTIRRAFVHHPNYVRSILVFCTVSFAKDSPGSFLAWPSIFGLHV